MTCPGYIAVAIPLSVIALLLATGFVMELLRRERTRTQQDDWLNFGKKDDDPPG